MSKLVDHLPLYRMENRYARQGVELSRSTLCGWMAEAAEVLTPLYVLQKARVLSAKVVHTDYSPIPVQDRTRDHCRIGRIWDYVSVNGVVYDATEDRCRDGPAKFLKGFQGYLQCDAYAGCDDIFAKSQDQPVKSHSCQNSRSGCLQLGRHLAFSLARLIRPLLTNIFYEIVGVTN